MKKMRRICNHLTLAQASRLCRYMVEASRFRDGITGTSSETLEPKKKLREGRSASIVVLNWDFWDYWDY